MSGIEDRVAKADPGNTESQRGLALLHGRIGDVLMNQDNLPEALKAYRRGFAMAYRLAKAYSVTTHGSAIYRCSTGKSGT